MLLDGCWSLYMTREQAGQSEGISTMCPLVFCIDTCLPHILDHFHKLPKRMGFSRSKVPTPSGNPPWNPLKPREHVHVEGMWPPPSCARLPEVVPSHAPVKQFVCPTDGGLKLQMGCNISSMSLSEKKRLSRCSFFGFHVRFCHCNGPLARSVILQISPLKLREFQTWSWPPHPHQLDLAGLKFEV